MLAVTNRRIFLGRFNIGTACVDMRTAGHLLLEKDVLDILRCVSTASNRDKIAHDRE